MTTRIRVITRNIDTNETTERVVDHDKPSDRHWLGKHAFWAMRNGREVTTTPLIGECKNVDSDKGNVSD